MRVLDHHGEIERRHVGHPALRVPGVEVGAEKDIMLVGRLRRDEDADQVGVRADGAALAGRGTKIIDQHAHRHAGAAAFAGRPVGDRLRATESGLGQEVVESGRAFADQMGEDLTLLLAGQVGTCRRSGEIELRGVARFPGHAFSHSPPRLTRGAGRSPSRARDRRIQSLLTTTTPAMISCRQRFSASTSDARKIGGKNQLT